MDIDDLIEKYLDGSISPDERKELFSTLKKDKGLLKDFVIDVHLDNALDSYFNESDSSGEQSSPSIIELSDDDLRDIAAAGNPPETHPDSDNE
jgi:hypothetical protein